MKAWTQLLEPGSVLATICLVLVVSSQAYAAPAQQDEHVEHSTEIEYYPVADATGCYYNFQHYDEGDRIITNEPCLNCTCHNQMLMCYLRVCPFTKAIGANCKVEKKPDQCCPVITCPEVPVQLVTSTAPSTALGHINEYGCSIDNLFYSDGARVPSNPENPCELCYCIRNKTACVMQECTLNVEGCRPVFQEGVCCPVRYNCEHPDYLEGPTTPQISTTTTTTTTTVAPTTTLQPIECFFNGRSYNDGELVKKDVPCEKCYCLRGDIVCAVQECGPTPLDKVNCTALPIREGQCCPENFDCAGIIEEELTTLSSLSYETAPTTLPTVDLGVTQGSLTTATHEDIEERKKLEGLTESAETPEVVTKATPQKEAATEGQQPEEGQHLVEEPDTEGEQGTPIPDIIEQITRETVEAPKPADHVTEIPSEQTIRPAIEETSAGIQEITEGTTEKPEDEGVTKVGVETGTTEKERVTFVPAISPEEVNKTQDASEKPFDDNSSKPHAVEELTKSSVEEETSKPSLELETAEPSLETETDKSSVEQKTHKPYTDTDKLVVEDETTKPTGEEETTKPTIDEGTGKSVVEDETTKPSLELGTAKPSVETGKPLMEKETVKPSIEEGTTEPVVEEETAKPTESPIESFTSKVTEAIGAVTTRLTEAVEFITRVTTISSSEEPTTKVPGEEAVTVTESPDGESVTKVISINETEPVFPTHPSATEQPEIDSDKSGVTPVISDKEKTEKPFGSSDKESSSTKPSGPEKEQPEISEITEESVKGPATESTIIPTVQEPTTISSEGERPVQDEHKVVEEEHETKVPITEEPVPTEEGVTPKQTQEELTEPSATERTEASEVSEQTKSPQETEITGVGVTEPSATSPDEETTKKPELSTEPSEHKLTEPTVPTKPETEQTPVIEETIVPQDCGEQGCVKIPSDKLHTTEQPSEEGTTPAPSTQKQPISEEQASVYPETVPEQATTLSSTEPKPETEKTLPPQTKPELTEATEATDKITTEKAEVVFVTEIPTKKTELPESMDHLSETVSPTESSEERKPSTETETENIKLEPSTSSPEVSKEPAQESTEQPSSEGPGKQQETQTAKIPSVTEEALPTEVSSGQTEKTETPLSEVSEESKATVTPFEAESLAPGKQEETVTAPIAEGPAESTKIPTMEITHPTTELPREEDNEIEHEEPVATVPKTESEATKVPEEQPATEVAVSEQSTKGAEVTTHKETDTEEGVTEKAIIPEVCTSDSECVPGSVPLLPEGETEGTRIPEEATSQRPVEPEQEATKPGSTTESNKIPETEEHTEETNEIPEGGTEGISKVTGTSEDVPSYTEESSGEHPTEVPPKEEEGSGQEPDEGSGFTTAAQQEGDVTETSPKIKVTKIPEEQSEVTTAGHAEVQSTEQPSESQEPATSKPQEISTEGEQLTEQPETEHIPEIRPTEYPESTEYPEGTDLPEREIPGEGSCLVDGQTYKNNSSVPPINHCQTSCKCASSILRCESIECTPPPPGMQNCMPIFISPDSCCPTYSCTGPETTSPMESDSHIIQTTTPPSEDVATIKAVQEPETEEPVLTVTTVTEEKESEESDKLTEATDKSGATEEVVTEISKLPMQSEKTTELPVEPEKPTELPSAPEKSTGLSTKLPAEIEKTTQLTVQTEKSTELPAEPEKSTELQEEPEKSTELTAEPEKSTEIPTELEKTTVVPVVENATELQAEAEKSTELQLQSEESTKPESQITEEPVITKHCDESGCKPASGKPSGSTIPEGTEKTPEATESSAAVTSPETGISQETDKPESETKEPQPNEEITTSRLEVDDSGKITDVKIPDEVLTTTIEPIIRIKPEEGTTAPESTSQPSEELQPTDKVVIEVGQATEEAETEEPEEAKPSEATTKRSTLAEQQTNEPKGEQTTQPETATKEYDEILPIATIEPWKEGGKERPEEEISTTEESKGPEQTVSTEKAGIDYSNVPEISSEIGSEITEEPEVSTKEGVLDKGPITKRPEAEETSSETGITEEAPAVTSIEYQTKLPAEDSTATRKPETAEPERVLDHSEKPSKTTGLPEKDLTPEVATEPEDTTKPFSEVEEGKITEQPTRPAQPEDQTSKQPSSASEFPEGTQLPDISQSTEGETSKLTTGSPEKEPEGQITTQGSAETLITEQGPIKGPEESLPHTTAVPKEDEQLVEHITLPPESESTGKPIESDSHVTSQEATETTSPKAIKEKPTERTTEVSLPESTGEILGEEGDVVTKMPSEVTQSLEETSKPEIELQTGTEGTTRKPVSAEDYISSTESKEHVSVTEQETAVTESVPSDGTKEQIETQKKPVETVTEQITASPEVSSIVTTAPALEGTVVSQTERTSEDTHEAATEVAVETSVTEEGEQEASKTEKVTDEITEKQTEIPSVEKTSPVSETEQIPDDSATLRPIDGDEPSTEDNEIPGRVPEKETPPSVLEQGPENTEQPTKEDVEKTTEDLETGTEILRVTEEGETPIAEGATTSSPVIRGSSISPEGEQASEQSTEGGKYTTTQSSKETTLSGGTEKADITEDYKTSVVDKTTEEGPTKPQSEKETPGETKKPIVSDKESNVTVTDEPTTGETKIPSVPGEEEKMPIEEQSGVGQTEQPIIPEETSQTLSPEQPGSQETKKPLPEEGHTSKPALVESEETGKPEEGKTPTTQGTGKPDTFDEGVTPVPEQPDDKATKPNISEEKTGQTEQPSGTEKPGISDEETKTPVVLPEEEAVTRKPIEAVFPSPEVTTQIAEEKENTTFTEHGVLFTSGPKVETTTKLHVPGELSTSAPVSEPTTILPATTVLPPTTSTESLSAHIPGEQVPELPDYEQTEYEDEDQNAFGPGTCRYGGKVYVSAQQIPREDPCDFCFCFRSDIICLQQSCPPPIPRCHEEPIRGFCCPRYECPVSMATSVNITTSTTTTTTTLPPHFFSHAYKGRASKTGCQISGKAYKVGEAIRATSGPCLHCTCGGDGQMKCDPRPCSPEPMLRQMIAAAASRRRR